MAYTYVLGPSLSLGPMYAMEIEVTSDAATGAVIPVPPNTNVVGMCVVGVTASALVTVPTYTLSTGSVGLGLTSGQKAKILLFIA